MHYDDIEDEEELRFEFLDLLGSVAVVSLLPLARVAGRVELISREAVQVIASRSTVVLVFFGSCHCGIESGQDRKCSSIGVPLRLQVGLLKMRKVRVG